MEAEVELKLATTRDDLPQLEQALLNVTGYASVQPTMVESTCYDTDVDGLKCAGVALQVRQQNGAYTQTVTREDTRGTAPFARYSWEDVIGSERPDLRAPNGGAHLPKPLADTELRARFTTVVQRTLFTLEPDGSTQIAGTIDEGEIRTTENERTEPICEIGLQLRRGDPAALYGTGLRLLELVPLRIEVRSEAERGYRLLESATARPQAVHSLPFDLEHDLTVEESLQEIGSGSLILLLRNELAALAEVSDGIHQMRVAVRRLRSVIGTMRRLLPPEQYEWVSQELRWIADVLGPARNWDVFSQSLLAPVMSALPSEQDLGELCRLSEQERRAARERASTEIRSPRYTSALLKLSQWFTSRSWRDQPVSEQSALLMAPIETVAPILIGRRHKKVREAAEGLLELTPQRRHEFRIAVKKLRYTIEVFRDLFDSDKVAEFLRFLKPLQDDLGYANDVEVAHEFLTDLQISAGAVNIAHAAGLVIGWHDRGIADLDRKLSKRLRKLRRMRPFW